MKLAVLALAAALMAIATLIYATHRREPEYAMHWVEDPDGWGMGVG